MLELRSEFNNRADKLISLLEKAEENSNMSLLPATIQKPISTSDQQTKSSLLGVRWDPKDYLDTVNPNMTSGPHMFSRKSEGAKPASIPLLIVGGGPAASSDFIAFRNKASSSAKQSRKTLKVSEQTSELETIESASMLPISESKQSLGSSKHSFLQNTTGRDKKRATMSLPRQFGQTSVENLKSLAIPDIQERSGENNNNISVKISISTGDEPVSSSQRLATFPTIHIISKRKCIRGFLRFRRIQRLCSDKRQKNKPRELQAVEHQPINEFNSSESNERISYESILGDLISYFFLIPAFDCKGRKVTLDQFDKADFEGISFFVNGLHPKSRFMTYFDLVIIAAYFICISIVPVIIGFEGMIPFQTRVIFEIVTTAVFILKSVFTAVTPQSDIGTPAIYSIREYELMRPFLRPWIWRWMKDFLLLDAITAMPFDLILDLDHTYGRFVLLIRLIRIYRLPYIMYRCALFVRLKTYLESKIGVGAAKIVPIAVAIFFYIHYNACMIFYSGKIHDFMGWSQLWMQMDQASLWESYIWSFMLAVGNMFPMSFKPQTLVEQFTAIIFIFVGAGLYAVLVGYISSAAMSIDNSGRVYNQKMEELVDYIKWRKLNEETRDKLVQYYETKYRGKYFEEDGLLGDMNEALRTEISLQNTRDLIFKVPFLRRDMQDHRNEIFYSRIASVLHVRYFIPGDCVTKQGESGTDMFFILSGKVDVLIDGDRKVSLYDGAYFGEVALITKTLRTATVQARMPSVLYRLTYQDFHGVINEFPDMQMRISELALERDKLLRLAKEVRDSR
ncbi:hypothetical protein BDR26DRAFT_862788 [Obelidium mucronatum]|nr:hypothetical protein BDR26DRAFT_862788 [Obelidium mucronatum]